MSTAGTTNIPETWWTFLAETELMKNIKKAHYLSGRHPRAPDRRTTGPRMPSGSSTPAGAIVRSGHPVPDGQKTTQRLASPETRWLGSGQGRRFRAE
jgi:hypothetical protein